MGPGARPREGDADCGREAGEGGWASAGMDWAGAARGVEQAWGEGKSGPQERESGLGWEVGFGLG